MTRRTTATQAEISRALKAARAAGMKIDRVEVEGAKVVVYSVEVGRPDSSSDYATWRAKRDAR